MSQKVQALIKNYETIDGGALLVTAKVTHAKPEGSAPEAVASALMNATKNMFSAVAGSFVELSSQPYSSLIQGVLAPTKEVVPFSENLEGFSALSSNMYMDEEERIWSMRDGGDGKVLVRAHTVDNPEEIHGLLAQCSAVKANGLDRQQQGFVAQASAGRSEVDGGDMITFYNDGEVAFGVAMACDHENETILAMAQGSERPMNIKAMQVVGSVSSDQIQWPDVAAEMEATASVTASEVDNMVAYYKKVFGHSPEYFAQIEQRIRSHAFM